MTDQLKAYARAMEAQVKAYAEAMEAQVKAHAEEMALMRAQLAAALSKATVYLPN